MGVTRAITLVYCGISLALGCIYLILASKKISTQLRHTWGMLEKIIDHTPSLVLVCDQNGHIQLANAKVFEFALLPQPEGSLISYQPLEDHTGIQALLHFSANQSGSDPGKPFTSHLVLDGNEFDFLTIRFPIRTGYIDLDKICGFPSPTK